ncbi:hypothetical protein [Piscinibacter sp. HJYY11]|uniref:hypothetical protein n=1 Tax=Piscinibacter sp. HJYY11 TaxID=2801333 RepID=UPI00191DAF86|nr:hypothetical protein [Piscinibacter sp. HJYY11]MBL0727852.1 hypothetical protein [Piscinibacter sp. HJYY11]
MLNRPLLALVLASLAFTASAADPIPMRVSELLQSERARQFLDPDVKLYWGDEATPPLLEISREDVNTGISLSGKVFSAGTREHCVAAFENALDSMIRHARNLGYDVVFNIRVGQGKGVPTESQTFSCTPAYRATDIRIWSSFGMTEAAAQRFADAQKQLATLPARAPAKDAIFMPLAPVQASPELKKILGRHVRAYWGTDAPTYDERTNSPYEYTEYAETAGRAPEEACRQATLKALGAMVKEARKEDFDSLVRIRSYHNGQLTPAPTDIECEVGKKWASVTLRAYMANRK